MLDVINRKDVVEILKIVNKTQLLYDQDELISYLHGDVLGNLENKYGIAYLKHLEIKSIQTLIDKLIQNGYLTLFGNLISVIALTDKAYNLIDSPDDLKLDEIIINEKYDISLYEALRNMRKKIADSKKVPSFYIFSNKTLKDICIKLPRNKDELLKVSGIGPQKLEQYGENIVKIVNEYINNNEEKFQRTISKIIKQINDERKLNGKKKIKVVSANDFLVTQGFLTVINDFGKIYKIATKEGEKLGIKTYIKKTTKNNPYYVNYYDRDAEEYILANIDNIIEFQNKKVRSDMDDFTG